MTIKYEPVISHMLLCINMRSQVLRSMGCISPRELKHEYAMEYYQLAVYRSQLEVLLAFIPSIKYQARTVLELFDMGRASSGVNAVLQAEYNVKGIRNVLLQQHVDSAYPPMYNFDFMGMVDAMVNPHESMEYFSDLTKGQITMGKMTDDGFVPDEFGEAVTMKIVLKSQHDGHMQAFADMYGIILAAESVWEDITEGDEQVEVVRAGYEIFCQLEESEILN